MAAQYRCFAIATFYAVATLLQRFWNAFFLSSRISDANTLLVASSRTDIWYLFVSDFYFLFFFLFLKAPILFSSFESCLGKMFIYCKGLTAGGDGQRRRRSFSFFHFGF